MSKAEITGSEQFFWAEVFSKDSNRRSVALAYALVAIENQDATKDFWQKIDAAVIRKFKIKGVRDFRSFQKKASAIIAAAFAQKSPQPVRRGSDHGIDEGRDPERGGPAAGAHQS